MSIKEKLKEKFNVINDAFFEKEAGVTFLRVEVALKSLDDVTKVSREISDYLDEIDNTDNEYFLDVYSSGTDKKIEISEIKNFLNQNVFVALKARIKDKKEFEGTLVEIDEENITIKWNAKGQIRKQQVSLDNISEIKQYAKA